MRNDDPCPGRKHLLGVREGRCDDRFAGGDGLGQNAGRHLDPGVVRKEHDVGRKDVAREAVRVEVPAVDRHVVAEIEGRDGRQEAVAVGVAIIREHLRMGLTEHAVPRLRHEVPELRERLDAPFDALARSDEAPREHNGPFGVRQRRDGVDAVRDDAHGRGIGAVVVLQIGASGLAHDDHGGGEADNLLEHALLPRRGVLKHGVEDDDGRDIEPAQDRENLVAVGAAVDSVFVLNDRDVGAIEHANRRGDRRGVAVAHERDREPASRARGSWRQLVGDPDDERVVAWQDHRAGEGLGERCEPATRRRVGAEESEACHIHRPPLEREALRRFSAFETSAGWHPSWNRARDAAVRFAPRKRPGCEGTLP